MNQTPVRFISCSHTLPEINSSPLKMDGWNTILSYWGPSAIFRGKLAVSFREDKSQQIKGRWIPKPELFTTILG